AWAASNAHAAHNVCLRRLPGSLLRRLGARLGNRLLLSEFIDPPLAGERPLESAVNGLDLSNHYRLRFRNRPPEIVTRRRLQPAFVDGKFVKGKACREPRRWWGLSLSFIRLVIDGEEGVCCPCEVRRMCGEQARPSSASCE